MREDNKRSCRNCKWGYVPIGDDGNGNAVLLPGCDNFGTVIPIDDEDAFNEWTENNPCPFFERDGAID